MITRWCTQAVAPQLRATSSARYCAAMSLVSDMDRYRFVQPTPHLNRSVYGRGTDSDSARLWSLARCGHHCFADGRAARHSRLSSATRCRFCASGTDSLLHALLECSACADVRGHWASRRSVCMRARRDTSVALFDTSACTARDVANNVAFVAAVCRRAAACLLI